MSFTENVLARTRRIETLLVKLGGKGTGIYQYAESISHELPVELVRTLRFIATIRNQLVHSEHFRLNTSESLFLDTCDIAIKNLELILNRNRTTTFSTSLSRSDQKPLAGPGVNAPKVDLPPNPPSAPEVEPNVYAALSAIVCIVICLFVLPQSCSDTRTFVVKKGIFFDKTEERNVTRWGQVVVFTLIYSTFTFLITRSCTKK